MRNFRSPAASVALGFIPLSLLTIAACSTAANPVSPASSEGGMCTAEQSDRYKGQPATAELGQRIKSQSGATTLRWLPKGTITTMEYRSDRVNVRLDAQNRIETVNCG